ncbi:MAG: ATP-dependent DNA helicase RecG [Campylobacterales bacterium]|nr:ATP-dependent DNA helicase RecG [Campylobacterales bacterium]
MEEAKQLLKRLKIYSLLDLALIFPSSYSDTTLSASLEPGKVHTLEATVEEVSNLGGKLRVIFRLTRFNQRLSSTFFRSTPYHFKEFAPGTPHIIQGRLEIYKGYLQMSQPRSLKTVGKITTKYKTVLKDNEIRSLIECYITEQNLYHEGLDSKEAAALMKVHFPNRLDDILENGQYKQDLISVFKWVEAFNHIKKLHGKRINFPALYALNGAIEAFVTSLPFTLTVEQQAVIAQIQKDLARNDKAAKRMVVGDVGSGKTMVILASAMMALPHKSILMAPTSLLALQLYEEACKYLPKTVRIALVMQSKEEGKYQEADFIIGTHALLYKEDLPQAALVMVDEQHRFGTKQRQSLEALVSGGEIKPHFIQFSATPIPRTQAMMESELVDVSLITTTPFEREVTTKTIGRSDFPGLLEHIRREIAQDHQVLIIYPLVEESSEVPYQSLEEARGFWEERFDEVYVTHGKDREKEEVLLSFREKGNILLATTVVEVGISLPRLTLIVIVGAERLGLATLHQLRGRVGRNGLKSWCYLYSNAKTQNVRLEKFALANNGFDIAKLDLQFRNSGDILDGTIQSGQKFKWLDMGEDEAVIINAKNRLKSIEKRK